MKKRISLSMAVLLVLITAFSTMQLFTAVGEPVPVENPIILCDMSASPNPSLIWADLGPEGYACNVQNYNNVSTVEFSQSNAAKDVNDAWPKFEVPVNGDTYTSDRGTVVNISEKNYIYFHVQVPETVDTEFNFVLLTRGDEFTLAYATNYTAYILDDNNIQAGWIEKAQSGNIVLPAGFSGWVKEDISEFRPNWSTGHSLPTPIGEPDLSFGHQINSIRFIPKRLGIAGEKSISLGNVYAADSDKAIPGLPDVGSPATTVYNLGASPDVTVPDDYTFTNGNPNGIGFLDVSGSWTGNPTDWPGLTIETNGLINVSDKNFFYYHINTPDSQSVFVNMMPKSGDLFTTAYSPNKVTASILADGTTNWVDVVPAKGEPLSLAAGFSGWVKLRISDFYSEWDDSLRTAMTYGGTFADFISEIDFFISYIGEVSAGDNVVIGNVFAANNDRSVPGIKAFSDEADASAFGDLNGDDYVNTDDLALFKEYLLNTPDIVINKQNELIIEKGDGIVALLTLKKHLLG